MLISGLSFGLRGALLGSAAAISVTTILLHRSQGLPVLTEDLVHGYVFGVFATGLGNLGVMALACSVGWLQDRQRAHQQTVQRFATELEAERSWLRAVIQHSPIGIMLLEGNRGERIQGNVYVEQLFGRPLLPEAGLFQCLGSLRFADGRALSSEDLNVLCALQGQETIGQELVLSQEKGRAVPILVSAVRVNDSIAGAARIVVVIQDITLPKELERQREEWTSLIAHDLRQPMTVIASYAELAAADRAELLTPLQREAIDQIRASANQLERMVADLLDASRIEARRMTIEEELVAVPELLRSIVDRNATSQGDHVIRLNIEDGLPGVKADPGRLEQILSNLLSNAAKYGYPGTEIQVRARQDSGQVEISVSNKGDGIFPEELPDLFSRFRRARLAREKKIAGIGLGLYIVKGLVEAHGGRIWAESVPAETTTFYFTLPAPGIGSDGATLMSTAGTQV